MSALWCSSIEAADDKREVRDFLLHEGQREIGHRVSYDALRRQAGVFEISGSPARRLSNWCRSNLSALLSRDMRLAMFITVL